jgi:hypothetical protein
MLCPYSIPEMSLLVILQQIASALMCLLLVVGAYIYAKTVEIFLLAASLAIGQVSLL